jgi:hypothetical protein
VIECVRKVRGEVVIRTVVRATWEAGSGRLGECVLSGISWNGAERNVLL